MAFSDILKKLNPFSKHVAAEPVPTKGFDPFADFATSSGQYRNLFTFSYNGEKNLGEIGPLKKYNLDYQGLSLRAWESLLTNKISATVVAKFVLWVIGSGLKLQSEPNTTVLGMEGIQLDSQKFTKEVESRFSVFCKSRMGDYAGMDNIHILSEKAFLNSIVGGDVLVVLRYIDDCMKVQLIDGCHIHSPVSGNEIIPLFLPNGNRIINGIELSPTNEHVAYHVRRYLPESFSLETDRIEAKSKSTGLQMAFLVKGNEYRLDTYRGVPVLATVLETLAKLDRYNEASVGSAEEVAKVAYQIVHQQFSDGSSPLTNLAKAYDVDNSSGQIPRDEQGKLLANTINVTTNKQAYNNPIGAKVEVLDNSKRELAFGEFYDVNTGGICAAVTIPPEVAMSKYDSNFSASRAALKDWEHTLNVKRTKFTFFFLQHLYNFWLETEILKNNIQAPGYVLAKAQKNYMVIESYRTCRFVGANVPHIDPLKEVAAERLKLGTTGAALPLTTMERATEALNGGESSSNMEQYSEELKRSKELDIEIEVPETVTEDPAKEDKKKKKEED